MLVLVKLGSGFLLIISNTCVALPRIVVPGEGPDQSCPSTPSLHSYENVPGLGISCFAFESRLPFSQYLESLI